MLPVLVRVDNSATTACTLGRGIHCTYTRQPREGGICVSRGRDGVGHGVHILVHADQSVLFIVHSSCVGSSKLKAHFSTSVHQAFMVKLWVCVFTTVQFRLDLCNRNVYLSHSNWILHPIYRFMNSINFLYFF